MAAGDFLRKEAVTPLCEHYLMAGVPGAISTNSETILAAACDCFCRIASPPPEPKLRLRFWVDPKGSSQPPWPKPFIRGLDHLVFAGFDDQNSILVDLHECRAIGRFSPTMGNHLTSWETVIFPILVSIMGAAAGITELHCGCVAREGKGLLLVGGSGSGKSTLALAMTQAGFSYLADDRTYLSFREGRIVAWGLPTLLKLRREAINWFPELQDFTPAPPKNGESSVWMEPARALGVPRIQRCEPSALVFLQRHGQAALDLSTMPSDEATVHLESDLMVENPAAAEGQRAMIARLVKLPCWRLVYGGSPQATAEFLKSRLG